MDERIEFGLYQSCENRGSVVGGEWVGGWDHYLWWWCYVCVGCDSGFSV